MSTLADMIALARRAMKNAHAPYSKFKVGACVRAASGRLYAGCNVENAAYPQGQCAEATAIGAMVTAGDLEIAEVVVMGGGAKLCTPCGGCRQKLVEFAKPGTRVHLCTAKGRRRTLTLGKLTPMFFGPRNLGK
jgi:cytidine deaminase